MEPGEEVAERATVEQRRPTLPTVLAAVVLEMAALAQRCEIAGIVVTGIMIEMGRRQDDKGARQRHRVKPD